MGPTGLPARASGDSGGRLPWAAGGSDVEHALVQRPTADGKEPFDFLGLSSTALLQLGALFFLGGEGPCVFL